MSRINQSHRGAETERRRDRETERRRDRETERRRDGEMERRRDEEAPHLGSASLRPSVPPSPRPSVSMSLCLRVSVAITLVLFVVACRRDMQDQPKYKPLAPSRFFGDGKSARQLVDGTVPYSPEVKGTPPTDLSKMTTLPFALTPQV